MVDLLLEDSLIKSCVSNNPGKKHIGYSNQHPLSHSWLFGLAVELLGPCLAWLCLGSQMSWVCSSYLIPARLKEQPTSHSGVCFPHRGGREHLREGREALLKTGTG